MRVRSRTSNSCPLSQPDLTRADCGHGITKSQSRTPSMSPLETKLMILPETLSLGLFPCNCGANPVVGVLPHGTRPTLGLADADADGPAARIRPPATRPHGGLGPPVVHLIADSPTQPAPNDTPRQARLQWPHSRPVFVIVWLITSPNPTSASSSPNLPTICSPWGSPALSRPQGIETVGMPVWVQGRFMIGLPVLLRPLGA